MRNRVSGLATSLLRLLGDIVPIARAAACLAIAPENIAPLQKIAALCIPNGLVGGVFFSLDSATTMTWNLDGEVLVWMCDTWEKRSFQPVQNPFTPAQSEMRTGPVDYGAAAMPRDGQLSVTADGGEAGLRDRAKPRENGAFVLHLRRPRVSSCVLARRAPTCLRAVRRDDLDLEGS